MSATGVNHWPGPLLRLFAVAIFTLLLPTRGAAEPNTASLCQSVMFEGSRFTVCPARRGEAVIKLADLGPDGNPFRSLAALKRQRRHDPVLFAMNAGMFDEAGRPIGLYVEDGHEQHPLNRTATDGNFGMQPNGVFFGDASGWHVAATPAFAAQDHPDLAFATQSGPMLVIDGQLHPAISADGPSHHIRNGVGVDASGAALFAIAEEPVSFGRFARLFRDRLGCANALYLDGTVSSLWDPASRRLDHGAPLGPLVVVEQAR